MASDHGWGEEDVHPITLRGVRELQRSLDSARVGDSGYSRIVGGLRCRPGYRVGSGESGQRRSVHHSVIEVPPYVSLVREQQQRLRGRTDGGITCGDGDLCVARTAGLEHAVQSHHSSAERRKAKEPKAR